MLINRLEERFLPVKGFEELYEVSNFGNVYSKRGNRNLKLSLFSHGYYVVSLCNKSNSKRTTIHRLVADAFIVNAENKRTVNHIDGVKTNNHVSNLEWATHSENTQHAYDIGLNKGGNSNGKIQGENSSSSKLTEDDIRSIRGLDRIINTRILAKMYKVSPKNIYDILDGKTWKHLL